MADEKKSARQMQIDERKDEMAKRRPQARRVRVTPANDEMRRALKHPSGNLAFPKEGSVEWPNDQFTRRRIADGSVTLEEKKEPLAVPGSTTDHGRAVDTP